MQKAKVLLIGDTYTGVTSIIERFVYDTFDDRQLQTIGSQYDYKYIKDDNFYYQIWSVSGNYTVMANQYLQTCDFVIIVFDVSDRKTFKNIEKYYDIIKVSNKDIKIYLVGNKTDCKNREVDYDKAKKTAFNMNATYYETSALTGENIEELFKNIKFIFKANNPIPETTKNSSWFTNWFNFCKCK